MKQLARFGWLPLAVGAGPACAHSPVPGIEGFYVGLLHPFSTPSQALLMFGLALLVSGFAVDKTRWNLAAFLIATFAGLFAGSATSDLDVPMFTVAFAAAGLFALATGKVLPLAVSLAAIGGFLVGEASIPDDGPVRDRVITMAGSIVGANLGLLYLFGIMHVIKERYTWPWVSIAFRVAAAWIGAIALLMLALGLAQDPPPQ